MDPDADADAQSDASSESGATAPREMRGASVMPLKAAYQKVEADFSKLQKAQVDRELKVSRKLEDLAKNMTKQVEEKMTESLRDVTDKVHGLEERLGRIEAALGISPNGIGGGIGGMAGAGMAGAGMAGAGMMGAGMMGGGMMGAGMPGSGMMGGGMMGMNGMGMGGFGGMGMGMPGAGAAVLSAVHGGNLEQLRAMLAQGADPNARDANGSTALHWAAQMNNEMMVRLLLSAGASKTATDAQGRMPFHLSTSTKVRGLLCC